MTEAETGADENITAQRREPKVFLHLTKTAGGTLKAALNKTPDLATYFVYGADDVRQLKTMASPDYDLIYGHYIFGLDREIGLSPNTRYLCFMRHPIMRTISHYYHLRNVDQGPVGDRIRTSSDINDFFANQSHWEFSNFMMKVISGVGNSRAPEGVNAFKLAVDILETRFDFVGFQEYFPISVRNLSQYLGRQVAVERDVNVGRYSLGDVTATTIQRIEELNQQDMKLYKFALRKFL